MKKEKSILAKIFRVLAGYEVAVTCMVLLFIITFFGTMEMQIHGLYHTVKKYFDYHTFFLTPEMEVKDGAIWHIPLPLPSTYWVSMVLTVNMICGGIIRIRKKKGTIGVIIAHFGIVFMLVAGFVSSLSKKEGLMTVVVGDFSDYAEDFHEPTIEVIEYEGNQPGKPWVVPGEDVKRLLNQEKLTVNIEGLPFRLIAKGYMQSSRILKASSTPPRKEDGPVVDGYYLHKAEWSKTEERNYQGCYVEVEDASGNAIRTLVISVHNRFPVTFVVDGKRYGIRMVREIWPMPFQVELHKSVGEYWPGTMQPSWFQSNVTKIADGDRKDYTIVMNKPMRHKGYTLYQAQYAGTDPPSSGFAIVNNPSDQWPLYSLIVVSIGLLIHFGIMLFRYLSNSLGKKS